MAKCQRIATSPVETQQPHPDYERFFREGRFSEFCWQIKHDGVRTLFDPEHLEFYSRNHKVYPNFGCFAHEAIGLWAELTELTGRQDFDLDGEVAGVGFEKVMEQVFRESDVDTSGLTYHVFDFTHPTLTFEQRHSLLSRAFGRLQPTRLKRVPWYPCPNFGSIEELEEFIRELNRQGHEGCVFKRREGLYLHGKKAAGEWVKGILDETLDLEVLDLIEGTGKLQHRVGAFLCRLDGAPDGTVEVAPGRATQAQLGRWWLHRDEAPKMIEVLFKAKTKDGSLRHPRFKRVREDK